MLEIQQYDDIVDAFGLKEAERALEKAIFKVVQALPKRIQIASYGGTKFLFFLRSEYDRFFAIDLARKVINIVNRPIKIFRETNINFVSNVGIRSEEHTSELQSRPHLVCRLLLEKKKKRK